MALLMLLFITWTPQDFFPPVDHLKPYQNGGQESCGTFEENICQYTI